MRRLQPRALAAIPLACAALGAAWPTDSDAAWPSCEPRATPVRIGATEIASERIDTRLLSLTLRSRAMAGRQDVDTLLPRRYDRDRRYPVLYLLHGAGEEGQNWLAQYPIRRLTADMQLIVVMPQGSERDASGRLINGGYADWFGTSPGSGYRPPAWESYGVRELVPFIDSRFATVQRAAGRAAAGISMGGGGAVKWAAQHPGTFGYAGSLSGELEPTWPVAQQFQGKNCKYGDPATQEVVWRDNDPTVLARNLRGIRLFIRSGDGTPGPHDAPVQPKDPAQAAVWLSRLAVEAGAHQMAVDFLAAAREARVRGINADFYPGSHSRPYWAEQLPLLLGWLERQLRRPVAVRRSFDVSSAHETFTAWGWSFRARRQVREFLEVVVSGRRARFTGSGSVDVVTPPRFNPGSAHRVRIGGRRRTETADRRGRLHLRVGLGPSHRTQQTDFGPDATTGWRITQVRIGGSP